MKQRVQKAFLSGGCVLFFKGVFHRTIYFVRHYRTMSKYMSSPPESIASSATQFGSMYPSTGTRRFGTFLQKGFVLVQDLKGVSFWYMAGVLFWCRKWCKGFVLVHSKMKGEGN